jgi:hypothetical protein
VQKAFKGVNWRRTVILVAAMMAVVVLPGVAMAAGGSGDIGQNIINWFETNMNVVGLIKLGGLIVIGYLMLRRQWSEMLKVVIAYAVFMAVTNDAVQAVLSQAAGAIISRWTNG